MNLFIRVIHGELIHMLRKLQKEKRVVTFDVDHSDSATIYAKMRVNGMLNGTRVILSSDGTWTLESMINLEPTSKEMVG